MDREDDNGFSLFSGAFILSKCWCISQEEVLNDLLGVNKGFCEEISKKCKKY